ncbi:isoprenylcysteine carboxylmethyltransferase family protein [bacterium]|nr:isoprenylcysteine carboxylmethyltransferase family protein [bacterium]
MNLIPDFKIGLWNAWIPILLFLLMNYVVLPLVNPKALKRAAAMPRERGARIIASISMPIYFLVLAYTIFLPLKLCTLWFWIGLPVYLVGLTFYTVAIVNYATAPLDRTITHGIYQISRHPIYVAFLVVALGIGLMSASWIFLVFFVLIIGFLNHLSLLAEERFCLDKYGDDYREYMETVRRYLGRFKKKM